MLGDDDRGIFRSGSQNIIQVFELCAVPHQPIEGKFVRDLQRKKTDSIKATAKVIGSKWIKRAKGSCHLRAKCRYEGARIRRNRVRELQSSDSRDCRSTIRTKMIEIKTDGIRVSPEITPLNVQPERGRLQFREAVGLAGKPDDDIRFEAVDALRHYLCDGPERRLLCIIGLMRRLIQRGGEFAELSYPSVQ